MPLISPGHSGPLDADFLHDSAYLYLPFLRPAFGPS